MARNACFTGTTRYGEPVTDTEGQGKRLSAVIYNPTKLDVTRLKSAVAATVSATGWADPLWLETTVDDAGQGATRQALDAGVSLILAAGGDGTIRAVGEALRGTGVALGLIPVGTGNLLARNLAIPLTGIEAAIAIAYGTVERKIDVGRIALRNEAGDTTEHAFLVMAGLGFDAAMIANTNPALKSRVGWLAYVDGGVRSLPKLGRVKVEYALDNGPRNKLKMSTILVANCGSLPGNLELFPDALLDDGTFDVAIMQPKTLFGWLMIWRTLAWENRVLRRTAFGRRFIQLTTEGRQTVISYLRASRVDVIPENPEPFELDGDDFGVSVSARFWVDPGSLVVKVLRAG